MRRWPLRRLLWLLVGVPAALTLVLTVVSLLGLRAQAPQALTGLAITLASVTVVALLAAFAVAGRLSRMVARPMGELRQVVLRQSEGDDRAR